MFFSSRSESSKVDNFHVAFTQIIQLSCLNHWIEVDEIWVVLTPGSLEAIYPMPPAMPGGSKRLVTNNGNMIGKMQLEMFVCRNAYYSPLFNVVSSFSTLREKF